MKLQLLYNNKDIIVTFICLFIVLGILIFSSKEKIDIKEIIKCHVGTLKEFRQPNISVNDIKLFFIIPIFISIMLLLNITLDDTRVGIIVTVFTIFTGLLFNILAILLAFDNKKVEKIDKIFMKEILYNVSFAIVVTIVVLSISILKFITMADWLNYIFEFVLYYLIVVFIMTLFMILKRLFNLLIRKINQEN